MVWQHGSNGLETRIEWFGNGRLSFHPIPCGIALFGHVTSSATCTARVNLVPRPFLYGRGERGKEGSGE